MYPSSSLLKRSVFEARWIGGWTLEDTVGFLWMIGYGLAIVTGRKDGAIRYSTVVYI
jgi:hypothetical protein